MPDWEKNAIVADLNPNKPSPIGWKYWKFQTSLAIENEARMI
jgi:hypothetical protein